MISQLSKEALERIASWAEILTVLFTMLGALAGVAFVLSTRPLRRMERQQTENERQKTAKAQKEAAEAQLELQKRVEYVRKEAAWRTLSPRFAEALKCRPKGTAEILYAPEDMEAYTFALQIWHALKNAGWATSDPKPIPHEGGIPGSLRNAPAQLRYGGGGPLSMISKRPPHDFGEDTPAGAIWDALRSAIDVNFGFTGETDPTLPEGHFIILVGQK